VTIYLQIDGMTCQGCASSVRKVLESVPLVSAVSIDLGAGRAAIEADATVDRSRIVSAIEDAGYEARILDAAT